MSTSHWQRNKMQNLQRVGIPYL